MQNPSGGVTEEQVQALAEIAELRQFTGPAKDFWSRLILCAAKLSRAEHLTLLVRTAAATPWKKFGEWSAQRGSSRFLVAFTMQLEETANRVSSEGSFVQALVDDSS